LFRGVFINYRGQGTEIGGRRKEEKGGERRREKTKYQIGRSSIDLVL
jgi:hypothetical protein